MNFPFTHSVGFYFKAGITCLVCLPFSYFYTKHVVANDEIANSFPDVIYVCETQLGRRMLACDVSEATYFWQWTTSVWSTSHTTRPSSVSSLRRLSRDEFYTSYRSDNQAHPPRSEPSTSDRCGPTGCRYHRKCSVVCIQCGPKKLSHDLGKLVMSVIRIDLQENNRFSWHK